MPFNLQAEAVWLSDIGLSRSDKTNEQRGYSQQEQQSFIALKI